MHGLLVNPKLNPACRDSNAGLMKGLEEAVPLCLLLVLFYDKLGLTIETAMAVSFLIVAVWWVVMTVPLLKSYRQKHFVRADSHPVQASFRCLGHVWTELKQKKKILLFWGGPIKQYNNVFGKAA